MEQKDNLTAAIFCGPDPGRGLRAVSAAGTVKIGGT